MRSASGRDVTHAIDKPAAVGHPVGMTCCSLIRVVAATVAGRRLPAAGVALLIGLLLGLGRPAEGGAQPLAVASPPAGATILDFNALGRHALVTTQFPGLTVSGDLCTNGAYTAAFGDPLQATNFYFEGNGRCGLTGVGGSGGFSDVTFTFVSPIVYFGLRAVGNLNFLTAGGSVAFTQPNLAPASFFGIRDAAGFTSVTLSGGPIVIDDVGFVGAVVPEPGTSSLLAAGLLGVGALRLRRRRRPTD